MPNLNKVIILLFHLNMQKKILIGDKDRSNRNFIIQIIKSFCDFAIKETDSVREFVNDAINEKFDLVILDCNIQQQGIEKIIEIIRAAHPREDLPIIVVSYPLEREKFIAMLKLGIDDFIVKPFANNSVSEKIRTVIGQLNGKTDEDNAADDARASKEKFLLVDHDRSFRNNFMRSFAAKYEIHTAENGQEGLEIFHKIRPAYVFIAEHIRVINERMLVQKIRSLSEGNTMIYFISSVLKSAKIKSGLFNGVIEKSADPDIFMKEFNKVVGSPKETEEETETDAETEYEG